MYACMHVCMVACIHVVATTSRHWQTPWIKSHCAEPIY